MTTCEIVIKPPFSYESMLHRLQSHPDQLFHLDADGRTLRRAFRVGGKPLIAELSFFGGMEEPRLIVTTPAQLTASQQAELVATIGHMFSVDVDLQPVYEHMKSDPRLARLSEQFRGLRFLLDPDLFQCMIRTIIGQQVNLAFAATLTQRLVELAGDSIQDQAGHTYHLFPTAEAVASLQVEQLREHKYSQRKAEYIIDFARAVVDGKVDLERIKQMEDEEVVATLTQLRGIGRWTVECLLMFGMGRPDLLPAADIGLRNGIQLVYELPEKPDEQQIRQIGENWAPWRSYFSLYMWEAVGAKRRQEALAKQQPRR